MNFLVNATFANLAFGADLMKRYGEINNRHMAGCKCESAVDPWELFALIRKNNFENGETPDDAEFHAFITVGFLLNSGGPTIDDMCGNFDSMVMEPYGPNFAEVIVKAGANVWSHVKAIEAFMRTQEPVTPENADMPIFVGVGIGWFSLDAACNAFRERTGSAPITLGSTAAEALQTAGVPLH